MSADLRVMSPTNAATLPAAQYVATDPWPDDTGEL
jgi:hypothetical protein